MNAPFALPILYEDNHLMAVLKPAGMLSQADLSGDLDVLTVVKQFLKVREAKPGNVYLGLVHRLDRPVSGVMLLARTSKCAGRLSAQFQKRSVTKIYRAVVHGPVTQEGATLIDRIEKDRNTRVSRIVSVGGKEARLSYRVLDRRDRKCLLEVDLHTGLPHQIRAQLSFAGFPIVGDRKYGSSEWVTGGPGVIALYAHQITFEHPTLHSPIIVTAPVPDYPVWKGWAVS